MRTDHAFAELFAADPDLISFFVDTPPGTRFSVRSETIKEIERRIDACFVPVEEGQPVLLVEVQGYGDEQIYYRMIAEAGLYAIQNPNREVHCLIVFVHPSDDPKTEPWHTLGRSGIVSFRVVYLAEVIERIGTSHPDHPLLTLLSVMREPDSEILQALADQIFCFVLSCSANDTYPPIYAKIGVYLMAQKGIRIPEEVLQMHPEIEAVTETPLWKFLVQYRDTSLKAKEAERRAREVTKRAREVTKRARELLTELLDKGSISEDFYHREIDRFQIELCEDLSRE